VPISEVNAQLEFDSRPTQGRSVASKHARVRNRLQGSSEWFTRCRRVSPEDLAACEERYQKSKLVHSIMRHVAETQDVDLFHLYSVISWPLYKLHGHAHDAFKVMVVSPDEMWDKLKSVNEEEGRDWSIVTPAVKEAVMKNVRRRMTPQPLKIRADLEMTCFQYGGVEHIKVRHLRWR
jgi:translation initiation factor 2 subunit 1